MIEREGHYKNLQTLNFKAKNIIADHITLKDTSITSDVMMAGAAVKKLYESQNNTNVFDDEMKQTVSSLKSHISVENNCIQFPNIIFRVPYIHEINLNQLPDQHACLCLNAANVLMYACNIQNETKQFLLAPYEEKIMVHLHILNDIVHVELNLL